MPKKLSVEQKLQRAQAHEVKGVALRLDAKKAKVESVLDDPFFLEPIYALVESLVTEKEKSSPAAPTASAKVDMKEWCEQYNKPKVVPAKLLRLVLGDIDKVTFSAGNVKALCSKGQREPYKEELAKYLEYATDIPLDKIIPKHLRNLEKFMEYAHGRVVRERLQGLLLPADFSLRGDHGVYIIEDKRSSSGGIQVGMRHDPDHVRVMVEEDLKGDLELEDNFSKTSATLCELNGEKRIQLCHLFFAKVDIKEEHQRRR